MQIRQMFKISETIQIAFISKVLIFNLFQVGEREKQDTHFIFILSIEVDYKIFSQIIQ